MPRCRPEGAIFSYFRDSTPRHITPDLRQSVHKRDMGFSLPRGDGSPG